MVHLRNSICLPIQYLMVFLSLLLILIIISGQIKEDYKYFILNTITLNLLYGAYMIIYTVFFSAKYELNFGNPFTQFFVLYTSDLAIFSCLPIAVNRFSNMYFRSLYTRFVNTKKIICFIIFYDVFMVLVDYLTFHFYLSIVYFGLICFVIVSAVTFSLLTFAKIIRDSKLLSSNSKTYSDAKRAALYCLLQALVVSINPLASGFNIIYPRIQNQQFFYTFFNLHIAISTMTDLILPVAMIMDYSLILFVLKTYRRVIGKFFTFFFKAIRGKLPQNRVIGLQSQARVTGLQPPVSIKTYS
uniref:Uncharacterized protein n=1 Tax=Acrobeloides nanus TaxID=290746 RepID=A0A914E6L8_9BILA